MPGGTPSANERCTRSNNLSTGLAFELVRFTGDLTTCALSANATGTAASQITLTPTVAADKKDDDRQRSDLRRIGPRGLSATRG